MPNCPFVHQILQSNGQKVPKSGAFRNEGIPEGQRFGAAVFAGEKQAQIFICGRLRGELSRAPFERFPVMFGHQGLCHGVG